MTSSHTSSYDVVVIGGGAAGLSGALALGRARRTVLVVDAGEPRNAPATQAHAFLTRDGTPPAELLAAGRADLEPYAVDLVVGSVAAARRLDDRRFRVTLDDGRPVTARRLLIASGAVDRLPDVDGLDAIWGRTALHCPYCHGWEVRDQRIGVLGSGAMSVHQALLWSQWSDDVVLFLHTAPEPSAEESAQLAARSVTVIRGTVASVDADGDRLRTVRLADGTAIERDALAVATRVEARLDGLDALGLDTAVVERGGQVVGTQVTADPTGATSVAGVWAAGNVVEPTAQVIASAAAGTMAGAVMNMDLITEDTADAVAGSVNGPTESPSVH
ncbi:thioredoxin reductase (NADPH) [Mumia flava]|uniref:Thioredoxin reductase (NADPH) n=1 Tax=Mumia flava TaxID=1348852 RepID=A0A0B2BVT9_9ACTN|nr:NAD(P)/FAD-dependent oxidoreductase [Mumia flava]PJJ58013.1 thioredoxin reductase (NADPH) [Mumia flava]